jgi:hypothetical protein
VKRLVTPSLIVAVCLGCVSNLYAVEGGLGRPISGAAINPYAGLIPPLPGFAVGVSEAYYDASIGGGTTVPIGGGLEGLTQWEVTIAELLSGAGYATGHFGKWHLGSEQGRLPNDQGFDEWYGIPRTTDEVFAPSEPAAKAAGVAFEHIMEGKKGEKSRELHVYDLEQRGLIDAEITRRTIDFIKRSAQSGKPFYAYVPFTLVQFPHPAEQKLCWQNRIRRFPGCARGNGRACRRDYGRDRST